MPHLKCYDDFINEQLDRLKFKFKKKIPEFLKSAVRLKLFKTLFINL